MTPDPTIEPTSSASEPPAEGFFASGTFWLTVVIVVLTVVLIYLAAVPLYHSRKKRIRYIRSATPVVRKDPRLEGSLTITWEGDSLTLPSVASVQIVNISKRDIVTADFDAGKPITVEFGSPIVALLEPQADASTSLLPMVRVGDRLLNIGPGLIKGGSDLLFTALVDGDSLPLVTFPLVDVSDEEVDENRESILSQALSQVQVGFLGLQISSAIVGSGRRR